VTPKTRIIGAAILALSSAIAFWPQGAAAQPRAVRRTPGRPVVVVAPRYYRPYYYYRPYFYPGFYSPSYWGLYAQYPYPPYGYPYPLYDIAGSARLQVTPRNAQVFVDGYFVGIVDDFDGYWQRLHVEAGEHELMFYLEGYHTVRQKVLFRPRSTLRIAIAMEPLAAGEANEPRPTPAERTPAERTRERYDPRRPSRSYGRDQPSDPGTLSLRVQPDDAVVLVDGEEWERPEGESRFFIDLAEGSHRLEVRKEGFRTYTRSIEVRRGETVTLNVSLTTGGGSPAIESR
jgi:hypothetical protein